MESQEIGIKPSQRVKLFISSTTIDSTDIHLKVILVKNIENINMK